MKKNRTVNEFLWPVRVYYEDTDAGGVVYYANYLRFMERARTEWLRSLGFEQDRLRGDEGLIFAVRSVQVDYLRPARFNDALTVTAKVVARGRASLAFQQEIRKTSEHHKTSEHDVLCSGLVKIVSLEPERFRPRPIPASILARIPAPE